MADPILRRKLLLSALQDWIWPRLAPFSPEQVERERQRLESDATQLASAVAGLTDDESKLKDLLSATAKALDDENGRRTSIETRLLNIAGLFSIAGTVVLGTLVSIAGDATPAYHRGAVVLIALCCFYLAAQVAIAIHASVVGVRTMGYAEARPYELIPAAAESIVAFMHRRIHENLTRLEEYRSTNNRKASQLNLAHCAVRNVIAGLAALATVAFLGAFLPRKIPPPSPTAQPVAAPALAQATSTHAPRIVQPVRVATIGPFAIKAAMPKKWDEGLLLRCVRDAVSEASLGRVLFWHATGFAPVSKVNGRIAQAASSMAMQRATVIAGALSGPAAVFRQEQLAISVRATEAMDRFSEGVDIVAFVERTSGSAPLPPATCTPR